LELQVSGGRYRKELGSNGDENEEDVAHHLGGSNSKLRETQTSGGSRPYNILLYMEKKEKDAGLCQEESHLQILDAQGTHRHMHLLPLLDGKIDIHVSTRRTRQPQHGEERAREAPASKL